MNTLHTFSPPLMTRFKKDDEQLAHVAVVASHASRIICAFIYPLVNDWHPFEVNLDGSHMPDKDGDQMAIVITPEIQAAIEAVKGGAA